MIVETNLFNVSRVDVNYVKIRFYALINPLGVLLKREQLSSTFKFDGEQRTTAGKYFFLIFFFLDIIPFLLFLPSS